MEPLELIHIESSLPLFKHCACKIVNWFTAQRFVSNTVASWNDKLFDKSPYSACRQPFYLCKAMRTWVKAALRHADYADLSQNATLHGSSIDLQLIKAFQFNSHWARHTVGQFILFLFWKYFEKRSLLIATYFDSFFVIRDGFTSL